jgi:hypothetical protein
LAFSLILGEISIRVFLGDTIGHFPRYHAEATYGDFRIRRLRPETTFWHTSVDGSWRFVVNKKGFRCDRDFPYSKPDGALRIMTLGDSHTQGYEVRQDRTYAAIGYGLKAEVINAGVSGFSTAEAAVLLEHEALKYDPDALILGFSPMIWKTTLSPIY